MVSRMKSSINRNITKENFSPELYITSTVFFNWNNITFALAKILNFYFEGTWCMLNQSISFSWIFSGDDFLIASGGDDNALVVSLIKVSRDGLSVAAKGSSLSAHATEITGILSE